MVRFYGLQYPGSHVSATLIMPKLAQGPERLAAERAARHGDTELESAVSGAFSYTDKNPGLHHPRLQLSSRQVTYFDCCRPNIFVLKKYV